MSEQRADYGREVRDTVLKSGFTGVAATVLAVTVFSPAGLGGMIGTSVASGFGLDSGKPNADDPYANLPAYPAPLTQDELSDIRGQLARTAASLEITRAATEAKIEHVRSIALTDGLVTFARAPEAAPADNVLSLAAASEPAPAPAPVEAATVVSYSGGGAADSSLYDNERHLELAELLLAHETF
jgi:hypothetical protein